MDEQLKQYNENQIILQELAALQNNGNHLSPENQQKMQYAMQTDQTI